MKHIIPLAALAAALAAATACSSGGGSSAPDAAACRSAMAKMLTARGDTPDTAPAACHGVPSATVSAYASQISASIIAGMGSAAPTATAPVEPANPVPLVKKAGFETSAVKGELNPDGSRYADGEHYASQADREINAGEQITCTTYADAAAQAAGETGNTSTDSDVFVKGDLWDCELIAVDDVTLNKYVFAITPQQVAQRLGGTVT